MKNTRMLKIITIAIPIVICTIFILLYQNLSSIAAVMPPCLFRKITGFLCPGCGNTRSVIALMNGDILTSLRYNITPVLISLILFLLYIELVTKAFFKHKKILPRRNAFWFTVIALTFVYFIARNLLPFPL